jgi:hypothetical protein
MAVSCSLGANPSAPNHGDTLTVTYTVTGNDPVDPSQATITGRVVVGGIAYDVSTAVTLPGTPAAAVSYIVPVSSDPSLIFAATADPAVFTAPVP